MDVRYARRVVPAVVGAGAALALVACTGSDAGDAAAESPSVDVDAVMEASAEDDGGPGGLAIESDGTPVARSDAEQELMDALFAYEPSYDGMPYEPGTEETMFRAGAIAFDVVTVDPAACGPAHALGSMQTPADADAARNDLVVDVGRFIGEGSGELPAGIVLRVRAFDDATDARSLVDDALAAQDCDGWVATWPGDGVEETVVDATAEEVDVDGVDEAAVRLSRTVATFYDPTTDETQQLDYHDVAYLYLADDLLMYVAAYGLDEPDAAAAAVLGDLVDHLGIR